MISSEMDGLGEMDACSYAGRDWALCRAKGFVTMRTFDGTLGEAIGASLCCEEV